MGTYHKDPRQVQAWEVEMENLVLVFSAANGERATAFGLHDRMREELRRNDISFIEVVGTYNGERERGFLVAPLTAAGGDDERADEILDKIYNICHNFQQESIFACTKYSTATGIQPVIGGLLYSNFLGGYEAQKGEARHIVESPTRPHNCDYTKVCDKYWYFATEGNTAESIYEEDYANG